MNKIVYFFLLILCIVLIPLSGVGFLGTMITDKYQVDHAKTFVEIDSDRLTKTEKEAKLKDIEKLENTIQRQQIFIFALGLSACFGASYLLIKRKKLIKKTLHNTI